MRVWLKQARISKSLSQEQVAKGIGISRAYYTRIERGERGDPLPVNTAKKIAEFLDFDWATFYPDSEEEVQAESLEGKVHTS